VTRSIYAVDIGSTRTSRTRGIAFAWAKVCSDAPEQVFADRHIELLAASLRSDLTRGRSVSLGFEAPMFLPVPANARDLSRARRNEGNRSWSAPAGLAVSTLAIHQVAWLLDNLSDLRRDGLLTTHIPDWPPQQDRQRFFCWEAFVSGDAHSDDHLFDAATAATYFLAHEDDLPRVNAVTASRPLSLFHASAIWAGWIADTKELSNQMLVLRPADAYRGAIRRAEPTDGPRGGSDRF
jgi:hypothetical protein